jgi:hypothetical protein
MGRAAQLKNDFALNIILESQIKQSIVGMDLCANRRVLFAVF